MGTRTAAPINEAVHLLDRIAPSTLAKMKHRFPEIADELKLGVSAGEKLITDEDLQRRILLAKAQVAECALTSALELCNSAIEKASRRLRIGKRIRLGGQITSVVGTSGVLGALGVTANEIAAISGVVALVGALASIGSEYFETIADPASGTLNSVYLELGRARYSLSSLLESLQIYLRENADNTMLEETVSKANAACEEVHSKIIQLMDTTDRRPGQK